ncbi:MAG: energy transducer TonB [Muricauda sp.]|nr:energy transducer TonB [Allomuricauda sp.]
MKKLVFLLLALPFLSHANDSKIPSKIKEVTVYLSGAQITRKANCQLKEGINKVVFTGLSPKVDESSIQVSGLQAVSILSMAYDINYLDRSESHPDTEKWTSQIEALQAQTAFLKNHILGLEEEERVINTNRLVSTDNQALNLEKVKEISQYYRQRITAIKNEVFETNQKIKDLQEEINRLQRQLNELNNTPEEEQGELTISFDAPMPTQLNLTLSYMVKEAGWVPNYDIKSSALNAPLNLAYKAHVYQKTGKDWNNVKVILSTATPAHNISKPDLQAHYLNFVNAYARRHSATATKKGYAFNPSVKKVVGTVTDASGLPLPGANVVIEGTTKGTQTDFDGNYSLEVPYGQSLLFSYLGQKDVRIPIYASIINVGMEEDANALEEVVVTALGAKREVRGLGYAVSSVSPEQAIAGSTSGIRIRGTNSNNEQSPLYIIDRVPVEGFVEGDLDASEIQNIEVLNGENATAIYGSRGGNGVIVVTTKKSTIRQNVSNTQFVIKKPYSIASDGDITAIEINTFKLPADYEYFAAPIVNENVFLTARFKDWEKHQLLPGEANIYFEGAYAGKTVLDPYTTKKEMVLSLGLEPNITVTRKQQRNFKSKSFTGSNRILNRTYDLEVKNNKNVAVNLKLIDRIPLSQNKEIKVEDIVTNSAEYDKKKGLLSWTMDLQPKESRKESFSFQVKYPRGKYISL